MRQAVTTTIAALSLAFCAFAQASDGRPDAAATLAQAKRLIEAKDYAPAATLLEDLLPGADAADTPAIFELLSQSYKAMARDAKAAGRDREAAHFLDNLAIISKAPAKAAPVKPVGERARKPTAPLPAPAVPAPAPPAAKTQSPPVARNVSLIGSPQDPSLAPAPPPEAAPVSEPARMAVSQPVPFLPRDNAAAEPAAQSAPGNLVAPSPAKSDPGADSPDTAGTATGTAGGSGLKALSPVGDAPAPAPVHAEDSKPDKTGPTLEEGDRHFAAGKYIDAGRCYAALANQNRLPAQRTQHWAYCRMVDVARRINLRPRSAREWDEIEAEIVSIQRLSPNIWYGEYLRNKVAEVRKGVRRPQAKADKLIVRGTAPDDGPSQPEPPARRFPRLFGNARGDAGASAQPAAPAPAASPEVFLNLPGDSSPSGDGSPTRPPAASDRGQATDRDPSDNGRAAAEPMAQSPAIAVPPDDASSAVWQVYETVNFRIHHCNPRLAEAAGQAAEAVRAAQAKRWASPAAQRPWTPACEIYLYPSGKIFARETRQPEDSPGFSTMECSGNRVVARRVNLRADHPQVVAAILPHEVTHVVLADLFTGQQIPRWADEGLAVLAEPRTEQQIRAAELREPLQSGRVFDLSKLMAMDYPDAKDWSLYYAQSVSLTRFLVEQAPPDKFIQFVQISQREGVESALRGTYRIAGLAELQDRWTEYARQQLRPVREASRDPRPQPAETGVR